jgi:hypothetical protein
MQLHATENTEAEVLPTHYGHKLCSRCAVRNTRTRRNNANACQTLHGPSLLALLLWYRHGGAGRNDLVVTADGDTAAATHQTGEPPGHSRRAHHASAHACCCRPSTAPMHCCSCWGLCFNGAMQGCMLECAPGPPSITIPAVCVGRFIISPSTSLHLGKRCI